LALGLSLGWLGRFEVLLALAWPVTWRMRRVLNEFVISAMRKEMVNLLSASLVMRLKMSLTNEFRMALALLEIPLSESWLSSWWPSSFLLFWKILTLPAVDSSALPAVEGGFGAISMSSRTSKRATKQQVGVAFIIVVDRTGLLVHRQLVRQTIKVCTEVEYTRNSLIH